MVKVEYDRDYYADLELDPTATSLDIKSQFKKLGMAPGFCVRMRMLT
jgi:hypothetical protein